MQSVAFLTTAERRNAMIRTFFLIVTIAALLVGTADAQDDLLWLWVQRQPRLYGSGRRICWLEGARQNLREAADNEMQSRTGHFRQTAQGESRAEIGSIRLSSVVNIQLLIEAGHDHQDRQ
jgi:hypothetical protein